MQYFDESDDKYQRIGKVIGDAITTFIVISFIVIFVYSLTHR
jgi:hypothetical protein